MKPDLMIIKDGGRHFRRGSWLRRISLRLVQTLLTLFGASILIWALVPFAEGDPATRILQARGVENPQLLEIQSVRRELSLDEPHLVQYFGWLGKAVRGDLSVSYQSGKSVTEEISKRLPATALLAVIAFLMSITLSLAAALLSTAYADRLPDKIIQLLTQASAAIPSFLLGLLILQFAVVGFGCATVISSSSISDVWLPAFCLSIGRAASWTQILRANLLEALEARYTLVAKARGATDWRILWRYALPNALIPFLTVIGIGIGSLLGGAAIVETVFSWNGIGSYAVSAIRARDLPVIQGFVLVVTLAYTMSSLTVDLLSAIVDPRLRTIEI